MPFDKNFIDDMKNRVDIVSVIGKDVRLKKSGQNYWGLCPFHHEKTPSFSVNEEGQFYHCFGCGKGGDVISFTREFYNLDFNAAVEKLCEDNGIEIPKQRSGRSRSRVDYKKYYEINKMAAKFYFSKLRDGPNPGYSYIHGRDLTDRTLNHFGIGYAPNEWGALYDYLKSKGVSDGDMLKLGLVKRGKNGSCYDKFRNRVIFPIFSRRGDVIGFGGRRIDIPGQEESPGPKYLNSDESDVFLKKNNLYALNFAGNAIRKENRILLVEGYMDVIQLHQAGIQNVVASLGTSLTDEQGMIVSRYTKNVILSYDSDNAGINAAIRGIDIMKRAGCNARILRVEGGKDPDEFVKKYGREKFEQLIDKAVPATEFQLQVKKRDHDLTTDTGVLEYIKDCVSVLSRVSPVEQDIYIGRLSDEFGISERAIKSEVDTGRQDELQRSERYVSRRTPRRRSASEADSDMKTELLLLCLSANDKRYLKRFEEDGITFETDLGNRIYNAELEIADSGDPRRSEIDESEICARLDPDEENIFRKAMREMVVGGAAEEYYKECSTRYFTARYRNRQVELQNQLEVAEKLNDEKKLNEIAAELVGLNRKIIAASKGELENAKKDHR